MNKLNFFMVSMIITAFWVVSCGSEEDKDDVVTGVTLDKTEHTIFAEEEFTLIATVAPYDAPNQAVTWASTDASTARVSAAGVVKALKPGTATIVVYTVEGRKWATCEVTVIGARTGNRFVNPGFEDPDDTDVRDLTHESTEGWQHLPPAWFQEFYSLYGNDIPPLNNPAPGANQGASGRVSEANGAWFLTGNGMFFCQPLKHVDPEFLWRVGKYVLRVSQGQNGSGGFYQIVPVTPGETYRFGGRVGIRGTLAMLNRAEYMKILSPDGMTIYHLEPIDYQNGDGHPDFTMWQTLDANGAAVPDYFATAFIAEGRWTNPEGSGITEVRFQYDHRYIASSNVSTPIVCWDEMFFEFVVE